MNNDTTKADFLAHHKMYPATSMSDFCIAIEEYVNFFTESEGHCDLIECAKFFECDMDYVISVLDIMREN